MLPTTELHGALEDEGVRFFAGVPDSLLKDYCAFLMDNLPPERHVITANEGSAVALVAGRYLATGDLGLVYLQNSGMGNAVNPLVSLADPAVYSIPMLVMVGWRGEPGVHDEPQHVKQGAITQALLESMGLHHTVLSQELEEARQQIAAATRSARERGAPHVLLVRKGTFEPHASPSPPSRGYPLMREKAVAMVLRHLGPNDAVVSTTGKTSRELFELTADDPAAQARNFLTVGSMGHASLIALGVALAQPDRAVYCLDGDGALIMHMGSLVTIGASKLGNFRHILLNNGAHESVGGQPTGALDVDFPAIACAAGYTWALRVEQEAEFESALQELTARSGPSFLEVRVSTGSRPDLGRPTSTPQHNRDMFMRQLQR